MNFLELTYFQKIAEYQNIIQAANELHVSQPALSKTLKKLEEEFGMPLFDRRGRGLILNEAGQIMKKYTDTILKVAILFRDYKIEYF